MDSNHATVKVIDHATVAAKPPSSFPEELDYADQIIQSEQV